MSIRRSVCAVGLLFALQLGAEAQSLWPVLFPELTRMAAPAWCKPGVRLLYRVASANIRLDPNAAGAGGGAGYTAIDVVAVDKQHAVLSITMHLDAGDGQGTKQSLNTGDVTPAGNGGDWWMHPAVLQNATAKATDDLVIVEMPHTAAGQQFQAVRFQYEKPTQRSVWVYDKATGIMLFSSNRTGPAEGDRSQGHVEFVGMRQIDWPWAGQPAPGWTAGWQGMAGQGTQSIAIPGSPATPFPLQATIRPKDRTATWMSYDVTVSLGSIVGGPPQTSTTLGVTGNASFNGLWIAPAAVGGLRAGQVLDEDPVLGVRRLVLQADGNMVVLREQGQTYYLDGLYEAQTGRLFRVVKVDQSVATTTTDMQFR